MREVIQVGIGGYGVATTHQMIEGLVGEHPEVLKGMQSDTEKESYPEIFFEET
jgi:hypothetical protein